MERATKRWRGDSCRLSLGSDIDRVMKLSMILVALKCKIGSCVSVYGTEGAKRCTNQEKHGQKCVTGGMSIYGVEFPHMMTSISSDAGLHK